jgi:pentatricopeptide repeat protein
MLRHRPPQDRSKLRAGRSPAAERTSGVNVRSQPRSFKQLPTPSLGTAAFNLRLGQFVDLGQSLKLLATLKEMKDLGLQPNLLTYNSAVELFGMQGMPDEAWALVDDMKASGITPDVETYRFLLQVHPTIFNPSQATLKSCL